MKDFFHQSSLYLSNILTIIDPASILSNVLFINPASS